MGRAVSNRKWRWNKKRRESKLEEYLMTPEEMAQSANVASQQNELENLANLPEPKPLPVFTDLSAYGEWRLPPGHENWRQARIEAVPDVFCPPFRRAQPDFSCRPASGQIFKDEYPELIERAKAYLEPPEECEGAVGYDQRYYETPYLIRAVRHRRRPPDPVVFKGPSILDARRCAQLVADDQKRQAAKARKMAKSKAKIWMRKSHSLLVKTLVMRSKCRRAIRKLYPKRLKTKSVQKLQAAKAWKMPKSKAKTWMRKSHSLQVQTIVMRRRWKRANKKLHPKPLKTESEPKPMPMPDSVELLLSDFEFMDLDSDSDESLKEFLRLERSVEENEFLW